LPTSRRSVPTATRNRIRFGTTGTASSSFFSQTKKRRRYHNLQRNPRTALSITDPDDPYRYLEIRGVTKEIEEDPDNTFIDTLAKKYLGKDEYPWHQPGDERVVVKVKPEHTTTMG